MTTPLAKNHYEAETDSAIEYMYKKLFRADMELDDQLGIYARKFDVKGSLEDLKEVILEGFYGNEARIKIKKLSDELDRRLRIYHKQAENYEGWSRFFTVPGGHIHSSMNCSTCNKNGLATQFTWNPELSGLSEKDAVKLLGPSLCTVCFPSAPVRYKQHPLTEGIAEVCPGSGTMDWVPGSTRFGYAAGNGGICSVCQKSVGVRSRSDNSIRKH